jgi:hypothetical protein
MHPERLVKDNEPLTYVSSLRGARELLATRIEGEYQSMGPVHVLPDLPRASAARRWRFPPRGMLTH